MSDLIRRAALFASDAHSGQTRKYTGTPFIWHPMRLAGRLLIQNASEEEIAAAWLHDTLEDVPEVGLATVIDVFGSKTASIVSELTNTSKLDHPNLNRAARKKIDRDRIRLISIEAKRIKLLDRIDNLRELVGIGPDDFARVYLDESLLLFNALRGPWLTLELELIDLIRAGNESLTRKDQPK